MPAWEIMLPLVTERSTVEDIASAEPYVYDVAVAAERARRFGADEVVIAKAVAEKGFTMDDLRRNAADRRVFGRVGAAIAIGLTVAGLALAAIHRGEPDVVAEDVSSQVKKTAGFGK